MGCREVFRKKPGFWGPAIGFFVDGRSGFVWMGDLVFCVWAIGFFVDVRSGFLWMGAIGFFVDGAIGFLVDVRSGFWVDVRSGFWVDVRSDFWWMGDRVFCGWAIGF